MTEQALPEENPVPKARRNRYPTSKQPADTPPATQLTDEHAVSAASSTSPTQTENSPALDNETNASPAPKRRTHRGGRGRSKKTKTSVPLPAAETIQAQAPVPVEDISNPKDSSAEVIQAAKTKSRRSRRGGRGRGKNPQQSGLQTDNVNGEDMPITSPHDAPSKDGDGLELIQQPKANAQAARKESVQEKNRSATPKRKMFISVVPKEQVEVALTEQGSVCEYYLEMFHQAKIKGNIYRGIIQNIDNNLQAAFVNYGGAKNGFLQIDEVHPEYWLTPHEESKGKKYPPIQKALKVGQEVLVQVVKEPSGTKGAFLTTWISLAGRFLVLTPGQEQIGVSRKVEEEEERARLRELMNGIEPGEGLGVIVRTVSAGTNKTTLQKDLQYLKRLWKEIRTKAGVESAPALVYQEPGLAQRSVRDYLTEDISEVWVDDESAANAARETINLLFPRKANLVKLHQDPRQSLWERFDIQRQLEQIYSREIDLPSGGRLVFDQTEALMAIDINSGKIHGKGHFEAMALKTNMEAAETIARQLRLRDIGGQIVVDFIEMRDKNHVRDVEKLLRQTMKSDRARHDIGRISPFGLLELVRQRTGSSALAITTELCPCCSGSGLRRNMEWQALQTLRSFSRQMRGMCPGSVCSFELPCELGLYLLNEKRERLRELERLHNMHIEVHLLRA